jgi:hypothetical protein
MAALVQDLPATAPLSEPFAEPFEEAHAPPPLSVPLAPPPPATAPRHSLSRACDVIVERSRGRVVLTAVADPDRPMSGDYSFVITRSGGGNSSDIEQGGPFRSRRGETVELSSSEISLDRGSSYRATLKLTSQGREVCRRTVRS